jgi:hypothetical protein
LDALLAAAVTAMVLVDLASPTDAVGVRPTDAVAVVLSLLQTLPLAFRRRAPLAMFILLLLGVSLYYPLGYEVTDGTLATLDRDPRAAVLGPGRVRPHPTGLHRRGRGAGRAAGSGTSAGGTPGRLV